MEMTTNVIYIVCSGDGGVLLSSGTFFCIALTII